MTRVAVLSHEELESLLEQAVFRGVKKAMETLQNDTPSVMTAEQAGKYLDVAPTTLRQWRTMKKGPKYHKNGGVIRYTRKDLDDWIKSGGVLTIDCLEAGYGKSR